MTSPWPSWRRFRRRCGRLYVSQFGRGEDPECSSNEKREHGLYEFDAVRLVDTLDCMLGVVVDSSALGGKRGDGKWRIIWLESRWYVPPCRMPPTV